MRATRTVVSMSLHDVVDTAALWDGLQERPQRKDPIVQDWLGNRWPEGSFPVLPPPGWRGPDDPTHGDGFRAGAIEWAALAIALRFSAQDERVPSLVEMGASQAPWCLSWVRAHRRLATDGPVRAVAYEAGDGMAAAERFWRAQDLDFQAQQDGDCLRLTGGGSQARSRLPSLKRRSASTPRWTFEWWHRAVVLGGGVVHFPEVDITRDNGAQAVHNAESVDYRGQQVTHRTVPAVDPADAIRAQGYVHLVHIDVQGSEEEMIRNGLFEDVRGLTGTVMLGTHSRTSEGLAMAMMPEAGFRLLAESPCSYDVGGRGPVLVNDGEQLWVSAEVEDFLYSSELLKV